MIIEIKTFIDNIYFENIRDFIKELYYSVRNIFDSRSFGMRLRLLNNIEFSLQLNSKIRGINIATIEIFNWFVFIW